MKPKISFLLGSGFSRPAGFPVAGELSEKLAQIDASEIIIHTDRRVFLVEGAEDKNAWIRKDEKLFAQEFLKFYCTEIIDGEGKFNYEDFYDFYVKHLRLEENKDIERFCKRFREQNPQVEAWAVSLFHDTFSQLLKGTLTKKQYWENGVHYGNYPPYDAFMGFLLWLKDTFDIKIHTLNHDLFFEFLGFQTDLCWYFSDGFSEQGSPYFGRVHFDYSEPAPKITKNYKVRLKYFQNKFDKEICLFKLHGSIDTYAFDLSDSTNDRTRVKTDYAVQEILKEVFDEEKGEFKYAKGYQEIYPDFLSGTTEKMRQYKDPYYENLLNHFKNNLTNSELLIVTGYGFGDKGINEILVDNFLSLGKQMIVIDPGVRQRELIEKYKAIEIQRGITQLQLDELKAIIDNQSVSKPQESNDTFKEQLNSTMYREFKQLNLPTIDQELLQFWESNRIFEASVNNRSADNSWVFYEGPPSANGKPGIHHVMARAIKDIFCRYQTLKGKRVERKGGWDTHGLPIELSVEKELGITKEDIGKTISVDDYNRHCRETVMRYKNEWDDITRKMGYWVDLDNPYITYENEYIETVWWLLKRLYDKGLLYKGYTIQPYSPGAGTGLSSHELNMPGAYREVTDTTVVALFKVVKNETSQFLFEDDNEDVRIAAWTTTPWTLPSNTALTVGGNIGYVKVRTFNPYTNEPVSVLLAKETLSKNFDVRFTDLYQNDLNAYPARPKEVVDKVVNWIEKAKPTTADEVRSYFKMKSDDGSMEHKNRVPYKVVLELKGSQLKDVRYEQLLSYGNEIEFLLGYDGIVHTDAFRVILGDFVTTEDGTGVVHTAPSFGADDMKAAKANGIGTLTLVNKKGKFKKTVGEFSGRYVKNYKDDPIYHSVDVDIAVRLKVDGKALNVAKYTHNYPHCWRTDKPVLYYPLDSWFIKASAVKERMFELNKTINWKPASTGEGRFGKWLENLQDWNLSRSRYWGIGLPIWRQWNGYEICIGSIEELREEIEKANEKLGLNQTVPTDLHRPYIDDIILVSPFGEPMHRESDLIDVWFDSGSMPYAQWGLDLAKLKAGADRPFLAPFDNMYPADFIAEGVDQTRGWFYTLHAIATMAFDQVSFKNVVSNGLVLDKNGNKMSKRLGNAVDPFETIAKYGADATRWYMISNAAPWDNLKFDVEGITEVQRKFFGTLFNTYNFFALYANLDGWKMDEFDVMPYDKRSELDRWVISKLYSLVADYHAAMDDYEPHRACRLVEDFVDEHLSNWYVRLSRRRFWRGEMNDDKQAAYQTLFECLMVVGQLASPVAPFFTDWLYRNLTAPIKDVAKQKNTPLRFDSVHLTDLVTPEPSKVDLALEKRMDYAQRICSLAFSIRKGNGLRVRLPLQKILLPVLDERFIKEVDGVKDLILSEINVKEIEYVTDASGLLKKQAKANFKTLGSKLGKDMKAAADRIAAFTNEEINALEKTGSTTIEANGNSYEITPADLVVTTEDLPGWKVASDGPLTVALDVTVTPELEAEGIARDLVNRIQNLRKDKDFNVTDRISVKIEQHPVVAAAVAGFGEYIKAEVLADSLELAASVAGDSVELSDELTIGVEVSQN